eukprot:scaffold11558_cov56-Attheya_sp.AAC.1
MEKGERLEVERVDGCGVEEIGFGIGKGNFSLTIFIVSVVFRAGVCSENRRSTAVWKLSASAAI